MKNNIRITDWMQVAQEAVYDANQLFDTLKITKETADTMHDISTLLDEADHAISRALELGV